MAPGLMSGQTTHLADFKLLRNCDFCGGVQSGLARCDSCGAAPLLSVDIATGTADKASAMANRGHVLTQRSFMTHSKLFGSLMLIVTGLITMVALTQPAPTAGLVNGHQLSPVMIPNQNGWYVPTQKNKSGTG